MDIADWINSRVLDAEDSVRPVANAPGIPAIYIVDDFLTAEKHALLLQLYDDAALWDEVYGLYAEKGPDARPRQSHVTKDEWEAAPEETRFFFYRSLRQTPPKNLTPAFGVWVMLTKAVFDDEKLKQRLQPCIQADLGRTRSATHALMLGSGHYQRPHSDNVGGRRLCGALYLADGWRPGFGGEFEFQVGEQARCRIPPLANRLVLFDPADTAASGERSRHCILPLTQAAGAWRRCSITVWWLERDA